MLDEIAQIIGKSITTVSETLKLLDLSDMAQARWRRLDGRRRQLSV